MNGTARNSTPGRRVATVTGIQTVCARRSTASISWRWTSRRMPRRLFADEAAERDRRPVAVEREHRREPIEGLDLGAGRPLAQGIDLAETLADAPGHEHEVVPARPLAAHSEAVQGTAEQA